MSLRKVYHAFAPHFEVLNIGGRQQAALTSTSDDLFAEVYEEPLAAGITR